MTVGTCLALRADVSAADRARRGDQVSKPLVDELRQSVLCARSLVSNQPVHNFK